MSAAGNRLALGTAQFGLPYGVANRVGQVPLASVAAMLRLATAAGVDTLDTAIAYGDSEQRLGEVGIDAFRVITKLPAVPPGQADVAAWAGRELSASLARLGRDDVYGLLLHRPQQLLEAEGARLFAGLQGLKEQGLVRKVGVSVYSPAELAPIIDRYPIDLVQAPFNLIDRRLLTSGWLERLACRGVEVHTRSAFLQGLLLMERGALPPAFGRWASLWDRWHGWLSAQGVDAVQACLGYPLAFPQIARVVVGADSPEQLDQLLQAASRPAMGWPEIQSDDEQLINPSNWTRP